MKNTRWIAIFAFGLLIASCGDDGDTSTTQPSADDTVDEPAGTTNDEADNEAGLDDLADNLAEGLEDLQQAEGGGSATLTVGDQTWTFSPVLCAFGEEMIGQEGAVFNLSSIQDGMQMYASVDSFGHSVDINDIENYEDPRVSIGAFGGDFLSIDGKNISGTAEFNDATSDDFATITGEFTATCP